MIMYDYLGVASYDSQSYGDDGSLGVSELIAVPDNGLCDVSLTSFLYSALNYVDGLTPTSTAQAVYEMGPESYALAGQAAGIYNEKGDAKTFFFTADLAHIEDFENLRKPMFQQILDYFAQYADPDVLPTSISISSEGDATSITSSEGTLQLTASVAPDSTTNKLVTWSIKEGSAYALIDADGLLQATGVPNGNGVVTVVATSQADESISAEFEVTISGQVLDDFAVLLVNDNDYGVDRYLELDTSLANIGYDYRIYNFNTSPDLPTIEYLVNFDVVIWYTGNDGLDLKLWDVSDTMDYKFNEPLMQYLNFGGCVWVQGLDFLYDVFGNAYDEEAEMIASFEPGQFVYDYMGIKTYVAQSHADDLVTDGTPQLDITESNMITELDPVLWTYTTMWYVDALDVTDNAYPLYYLGDMTYDFSLYYAAVLNEKDAATVITYTFETARLDTEASTDALLEEMLAYLEDNLEGLTAIDETSAIAHSVYPIPAQKELNIALETATDGHYTVNIYDLAGRQVQVSDLKPVNGLLKVDVSHLRAGSYIYNIEQAGDVANGSFIIE